MSIAAIVFLWPTQRLSLDTHHLHTTFGYSPIYYCLCFLFELSIGFLDKCHTSALNALINDEMDITEDGMGDEG